MRAGARRSRRDRGKDVRMATLPLSPDELLTTTRAGRKRLDLTRPVPLDLIRECLTIALQAPSGSNRQHWEWIVVTDPKQRAGLGELYRRARWCQWPTTQARPSGPRLQKLSTTCFTSTDGERFGRVRDAGSSPVACPSCDPSALRHTVAAWHATGFGSRQSCS